MWLGAERPPEALGAYTGFLLNWCAARTREAFAAALAELELRPPQFGVLTVIAERPGLTQQDLVAATGIDPSSMVQMLDGLERDGLAERRPHPTDRRKRAIHVTDRGHAALARGRTAAERVGREAFAALSADEVAQLHALLRKLAGLDEA